MKSLRIANVPATPLHLRRASAVLGLILLGVFEPRPVQAEPPVAIESISFDWSSFLLLAPGSDNWPITWCEDGKQYTSFGDGGGFGGTNSDGRVELGFGVLDGPHSNFSASNLWGGKNPITPASFGGKVETLLCVGGKLYAWRGPASDWYGLVWKQLIVSDDKSITWQDDAFPDSRIDGEIGGPVMPYFINFGQNYASNQDGYVYTYWVKLHAFEWEVQTPGVIWLTRAPAADEAFADPAQWEWFAGRDATGLPTWSDETTREPVLVEPEGVMRGSALYLEALDLYLMIQNHTARNSGGIVIWQSRTPWGPWSEVMREYDWPANDPAAPVPGNFTFGAFGPGWFSPDATSGALAFFRPDQWNSVAFTLPEPTSAWAGAAGVVFLAWLHRKRPPVRGG